MSASVSRMFGAGLERAAEVRQQLLAALGAEEEWVFGDGDSWMWVASPLGTRFLIEPVGDATPELAVVHVVTRCAYVHDLEAARALVNDLNLHSTTSRWALFGDPGPDGWFDASASAAAADLPYEHDPERFHRHQLIAPPDPDVAAALDVGLSVVVGDPDVEVPLDCLTLMVREQIAKAVAIVTNGGIDHCGEPAVVVDDGDEMRRPWADVVHHYDRIVSPRADASSGPLLVALAEAFAIERGLQFEQSEAAWVGTVDGQGLLVDDGFTCEVPYGPGPFELGTIGMRSMSPELMAPHNETSLLQGSLVNNPHLGSGLLLTLRVAHQHSEDPTWWQAALLNAQTRSRGLGWSPGYAHGLGAWCEHEGEPKWACFVPAYWAQDISAEQLVSFFRQLVANAARLSWGARRVVERDDDLQATYVSGRDLPAPGLAAGASARGREFGEAGVGVDPGAHVLAAIYDNLVGVDDAWAVAAPGGFVYWASKHPVTVTRQPCGCDDVGAVVTLATLVTTEPSASEVDAALTASSDGGMWAVCVDDGGGLHLSSSFHAHEDALNWLTMWAPAVAVAQLLDAARLSVLRPGSAHPELGDREDTDNFLSLFDEPDWQRTPGSPATPRALVLGQALTLDGATGGSWEGDRAAITWLAVMDGEFVLLRTRYGRDNNARIHDVLDVQTQVVLDAQADARAWCLAANDALALRPRAAGTVLGGWSPAGTTAAVLRTQVPLAFDRSVDLDGHSSFVGTVLQHHLAAVTRSLPFSGVAPPPLVDLPLLAEELATLPAFYGTSLPSDEVAVELHDDGLTITRSLPGGARPRADLGLPEAYGDGRIRLLLRLQPAPELYAALVRVVHGICLAASRPGADYGRMLRPLASRAGLPTQDQVDVTLRVLAEQGLLTLEDGKAVSSRGVTVTTGVVPDDRWGSVLQLSTSAPEGGQDLALLAPPTAFLPAHRLPYDVVALLLTALLGAGE